MISFYETSLFQHVWILNMRDKGLIKLSNEIHFPRIWVGRGGPRKCGTHPYMRVWLHISVISYVISWTALLSHKCGYHLRKNK